MLVVAFCGWRLFSEAYKYVDNTIEWRKDNPLPTKEDSFTRIMPSPRCCTWHVIVCLNRAHHVQRRSFVQSSPEPAGYSTDHEVYFAAHNMKDLSVAVRRLPRCQYPRLLPFNFSVITARRATRVHVDTRDQHLTR